MSANVPAPKPRPKRRLLITGASGCVGHYLVEELLRETDDELVLLLRDPDRLRVAPEAQPRVTVHRTDLADSEPLPANAICGVDGAVLLAASWGGPQAERVNLGAPVRILEALDPARCRNVVYLSTASILDSEHRILDQAGTLGTEYIRSKWAFQRALPALSDVPAVTTLFPTVVLGGDETHPRSHAANLLRELLPYVWMLRHVRFDRSFHWIHARDLARIVRYALQSPPSGGSGWVVGYPPITMSDALAALCAAVGCSYRGWVPLSAKTFERILPLTPLRLSRWDRFCVREASFVYGDVVSPETLGIPSSRRLLAEVVRDVLSGAEDWRAGKKTGSG